MPKGNLSDDDLLIGQIIRATPLDNDQSGINASWRAEVKIQNGDEITAYVKTLPPRRFMTELVCARLGRMAGLPIPRPVVAHWKGTVMMGANT